MTDGVLIFILVRAAQKIKETLIARAKLKKSYSKVLKREGMQSERLGTAPRVRSSDGGVGGLSEKKRGKQRAEDAEGDSDVDMDGEGDSEDDDELSSDDETDADNHHDDTGYGRRQAQQPQHQQQQRRSGAEDSADRGARRAAARAGPPPPSSLPAPPSQSSSIPGRSSWKERAALDAAAAAAAAPTATRSNDQSLPSLREMKREAYLGPKPKTKDDKLKSKDDSSSSASSAKKGFKADVRGSAGGSRTTGQTSVGRGGGASGGRGGGYSAGGSGQKRDNRPRMGARIGVMLEEIKRSKGIA